MALGTNTKSEVAATTGILKVTYHFVGASGNSDPFDAPDAETITLQATGTFDSATYTVEKSNDGTNFVACSTAVAFTSAGIKSLVFADLGSMKYRVVVSGGMTTSDVVVTAILGLRKGD